MNKGTRNIFLRATMFLLAIFLFLEICYFSGNSILVINDKPEKSDVIIVLGYPVEKNGEPGPILYSRIKKGVDLYLAGYAPAMIFSGSAVKNSYIEAQVMADYARNMGVPGKAIFIEDKSKDTIENVCNTIAIMGNHDWKSAIVVTSPYHTLRTKYLYSKYKIKFQIVQSQQSYSENWSQALWDISYEYIVFFWYIITGSGC